MILKDKVKKLRLKKVIIKQEKHYELRKVRNLKENNHNDRLRKKHANELIYYKKHGKQIFYYSKNYLNKVNIKDLIRYDEMNKSNFNKKGGN